MEHGAIAALDANLWRPSDIVSFINIPAQGFPLCGDYNDDVDYDFLYLFSLFPYTGF